jgi:hypothetical protein
MKTNSRPECTAHLTINRGRVKLFDDKIYLKNGSNFEIELFNPHSQPVMAKISINGNFLSESGLILKPGQRVFLERFIDDNKKLLFETYEVEKTEEALEAIKNNGDVEVFFYHTAVTSNTLYIGSGNTSIWTTYPTINPNRTIPPYYFGTTSTYTDSNTLTSSYYTNGNVGLSSTSPKAKLDIQSGIRSKSLAQETGRIEKGGDSSQLMVSGSGNFNSWFTEHIKIQILPESQRAVEITEIRRYCTGCGARIKKHTWKFCPGCGTKS